MVDLSVNVLFLIAIGILTSPNALATTASLRFSPVVASKADNIGASPLRSPKGVEKVIIHPRVQFVQDRALPACANVSLSEVTILGDPLLRPWSGAQALSLKVYESWKTQKEENVKLLRYADKNQRLLSELGFLSSLTSDQEKALIDCTARKMILQSSSGLYEAVCSCMSQLKGTQWCSATDYYTLSAHCHDDYAAAADLGVCDTLLSEDLGVSYSKMCSGWVAGIVTALDMNLYDMLDTSFVPDDLDDKTARQEIRTYYLAWKALNKLGNWADAHLLCGPRDSGKLLQGALQDIEIVPGWNTIQTIWSHDLNQKTIPLAVLAQREEKFLLVVRDTKTEMEGRFEMTNRFAFEFMDSFPGKVQLGYANVAALFAPTLVSKLKESIGTLETTKTPSLMVVGSGAYGSGVASIAAMLVNLKFTKVSIKFDYSAIFFGSPAIGDEAFVEAFGAAFNVRNIVSDRSALSNFPCTSTLTCGYGDTLVYTGPTGQRLTKFTSFPGTVTIASRNLSGDEWKTEHSALEALAHKICAPSCWFYSTACPDEAETSALCGSSCPVHFS